ncbi:MAG: DUF21 domain-containing protein [Dethiosulfatibacter sp.]|nr:DUF21 domain-containing protein [Dethiosulfatibacter sp.]
MKFIIWFGIFLCLSQSAMFSGLNLAFFSISKLRLQLEVEKENADAIKVMHLRENANFLLVTILWGNVSVNVLLALLSGSVLAGISAFLFSTIIITIVGEIIPQAYFSRHALRIASKLSPVIRFYQILLYPVAKPTAFILDHWLGKEAVPFYGEEDFRELVKLHMKTSGSEIDKTEGKGVLNFLDLDDRLLGDEGEILNPDSVIMLPFINGKPLFPIRGTEEETTWTEAILSSGKKWVVFTDKKDTPKLVMNVDRYLRDVYSNPEHSSPILHCHRPIVLEDADRTLGSILPHLTVNPQHKDDDVIDEDIIILWGDERKIITGSDFLGRLLRGIVQNREAKDNDHD